MITEKVFQKLYVALSLISLQERRLEAKGFDNHTTTPLPSIRRKSQKSQLHTFKYLTSFWICQYSEGKSAFDSYKQKPFILMLHHEIFTTDKWEELVTNSFWRFLDINTVHNKRVANGECSTLQEVETSVCLYNPETFMTKLWENKTVTPVKFGKHFFNIVY